jgi:hypothetical protein
MKKNSRKSHDHNWRSAPLVRGALNNKAKGELGEIAFLHKASSLGFGVAKPYGEKEAYDFILDSGKRLWRVQVKSIYSPFRVGYRTMGRHTNHDIYKAEEIDFLVAYIAPREIWYVIPVDSIAASRVLAFYPSGCKRGGHFECWREAWHLMAPGPDATPQPKILRRIHAMACERSPQFWRAVEPSPIYIDGIGDRAL